MEETRFESMVIPYRVKYRVHMWFQSLLYNYCQGFTHTGRQWTFRPPLWPSLTHTCSNFFVLHISDGFDHPKGHP